MTDGVRTVKDGPILEVTIDRPKANAIDLKASRRLNQIVSSFRCRKHPKGLRAGKCHPAKFHHWFGHRETK